GDVRRLFLLASERQKRKLRMQACMTLKVMHIVNYQEGHELLSRLPFSGAEVSILLRAKVERVVRGLLERKFPVVDFAGNSKTNDSILSKLLAIKDTQAARVLDKLRFRLVVDRTEDIPSLVMTLLDELVPFNYVVPNQSSNTLLEFDRLLQRAGNVDVTRVDKGSGLVNEAPENGLGNPQNEFSGPSYRVVSFVSEVPVRVDPVLPLEGRTVERLGRLVFGTVELQIVDQVSSERNESGENRHALYKARQRSRVKERLERGKRGPL
ncbi:MAG: TIGR04552 family protein, partial [Myxococcota bacterium]